MKFSTWNAVGLERMRDEIEAAFAPMVSRESRFGDRAWARHVWKRRRRLLRASLEHWVQGPAVETQRSTAAIRDEYEPVWARGYERYQLQPKVRHKPFLWGRRRYWANSMVATRFRQAILSRIIEHAQPKQVLEVGCGNGINLILLSCRFPDIAFTGLELTEAGHAAATRFQEEHPVLPEAMQAFAPLPLSDPTAFRRIRFVRGSAENLPFAGGAFDLLMTILALEQMERIRPVALAELARVTGRHAFLIEPFRELNDHGWRRFNRIKRDYFAGRVSDLPQFGLEPEFVVADYPQEVFLRTCAVLCRKHVTDLPPAP
jgi:ubiquinone/menaquinone biosynthesis C-methylase UbiE